jgi:hypothetical protein
MASRCDLSDAKYCFIDGVRVGFTFACGYKKEKHDCAVIATAVTADISYRLSHAIFEKVFGRKRGEGTGWYDFIYKGPFRWRAVVKKSRTLKKFVYQHPGGRYVVLIRPRSNRCHVCSVVDGTVYDCGLTNPRSRVVEAWKFCGLKKGI